MIAKFITVHNLFLRLAVQFHAKTKGLASSNPLTPRSLRSRRPSPRWREGFSIVVNGYEKYCIVTIESSFLAFSH